MSGNNIQKLQVIDPGVLKSLLEQLNANTRRQTITNILEQPEMNNIIPDYDTFVAAPEKSQLKETYRQNLMSRIGQYKNKRNLNLRSTRRQGANENNREGQDQGDDDDGEGPSNERSAQLHARSVIHFQSRLSSKGIRRSKDGFLTTPQGKKTNILFDNVLNDFGKNIKKPSNFKLAENEKNRVLRILGESGFAQYNIPNKVIERAYGTNVPEIRKYLVKSVSPIKKNEKKEKTSYIR